MLSMPKNLYLQTVEIINYAMQLFSTAKNCQDHELWVKIFKNSGKNILTSWLPADLIISRFSGIIFAVDNSLMHFVFFHLNIERAFWTSNSYNKLKPNLKYALFILLSFPA